DLARRGVLVRREHDAEGREGRVEAFVRERQRLGIRHLERDGQALGGGALLAAVEPRRDLVGRGGLGGAAGRGERGGGGAGGGGAVAGGEVEDALAGLDVDRLAQALADDLQRGADDRIVAGRPGRLLALLDGGVVGGGSALACHCGCAHGGFSFVVLRPQRP